MESIDQSPQIENAIENVIERQYVLVSNDNKNFEIDSKSIEKSKQISQVLKDFPLKSEEKEVKIDQCPGDVLQGIVEYLIHYKDSNPKEIPKPLTSANIADVADQWDCQFLEKHNMKQLLDIMNGAENLQVEELFRLIAARIACEMFGKTYEEIAIKFNILSDLTDEEKQEFEGYQIIN